ncbi:MAG: hypothetical protein KBT48_11720 [Firmicutes bacterium]|nr:hypothetical protein [Bacillota bacterium]
MKNFSVVIDPNDEDFDGKGYCRVFLDYGTYTITALDQEELDGYTFINTTYGDENQIAVVQKSLTSNIVPISFTKHYGVKEILEEAKAKKSHKHAIVQQVVQTPVVQVEEVKPEGQIKSSEALPLQAEHKDMKFEKKEVVKKAVTTAHVSTNWNIPVILAGLAGILVCLKKILFLICSIIQPLSDKDWLGR